MPPDDTTADPQAVITALRAECDAALAREAALAEVLTVINRSTGDPGPAFQTILRKAHRLCGATIGSLATYDGAYLRSVAAHGYPSDSPALVTGAPFRPTAGASQRLLDGERLVHYTDVAAMPPATFSNFRHVIERLGVRTVLLIPLRKDGAYVGGISALRTEAKPFSEVEISLLESFAAQAVIAIENARLIAEQREALEQQTATAEVLQVINASPGDLTPVFDAMLEKAMRLCGAAFGVLRSFDGERLRILASRGVPSEYAEFLARYSGSLPAGGPAALGTSVMQALQTRLPAQRLDAKESAGYKSGAPGGRAIVDLGGARTVLHVPLVKDQLSIGLLTFYRQEVRSFSDKQIALLQNFAGQAVIAMENARLLTEQREALEQQTAAAEVLEIINRSPGELTPVFDAMLEKGLRLCDAAFGNLWTYDGEVARLAAICGSPPDYRAELVRMGPQRPEPGAALLRLVEGEPFIHMADIAAEGAFRSGVAVRRMLADRAGARTVLWVPMRKDSLLLGFFTIYRTEVRPFTDKQIALLQSFAGQAVIAMENARLLGEQREALEQQTATAEVLQVINTSPGNLAPIFEAMLDKAMRLCGAAFGSFYTYDGGSLHSVAQRGVPSAYAEYRAHNPAPIHRGTGIAQAIATRTPHKVLDLMATEAFAIGEPAVRAMVELGGVRTLLSVPLCKDETVIGLITIYRQDVRAFSDKQISLLESFAAQAVIAMENARLLTEQREALEQQTATAEVLQVINASPGKLTRVFDSILEKAHVLCGAPMGALVTYDGKYLQAVATRGYSETHDLAMRRPFSPNWMHQRLLDGARLTHFPDIRAVASAEDGEIARTGLDSTGMRTAMSIPLRKDGSLLGFISAFRPEVRPFSAREIALLENFAAQAVIAMENARLLNEQREALDQQTATAEVLRVINASPGNLMPVFDAMLEKAMRLCEAGIGSLYTYDGERFHSAAQRGVPPAYAVYRAKNPSTLVPDRGTQRVLETKRPHHVLDLKAGDFYREDPHARAMVDLGGVRSLLSVPLVKDDVLRGYISLLRQEVRPFSDKQIALLESFAAQAVIAMENARLLSEIRQRQEELRITFENMGDGVAMFDETQRLVAWNGKFQEIFDLPDALLGQRCSYEEYLQFLATRGDFGPGVDTTEQILELVASTGQSYGYERTRPDGRVIEIRRNPVPDGGFVLIYSDITERKRSEAEISAARDAAEAAYRDLKAAQANLIQAEKMASLGQLTAGIAHEIKNPLNFVNNFASLSVDLLDELKATAAPGFAALDADRHAEIDELTRTLASNLEKINEHGRRADGIVRSMLDHSRGSSGERRSVDLNALVDESLNLAYHGARAQDQSFNVTLRRDLGVGIAPITLAPQDITRVLLNLFSNGFYATRKRQQAEAAPSFEPILEITTRERGDAVEIRVRDNGTGISPDIRDKLFQPFFSTKPTGEGTGLGLSISYDIVVQQHGGTIGVDSMVGDYSEFTVTLPRSR